MKVEPEKILDRDLSKTFAREEINLAQSILKKAIDYGIDAFKRCSIRRGGDENLAILSPYLHIVEMSDAVEVLVSEAISVPTRVILRSIFEALITIEFITESDSERRAYSKRVADIRSRISTYKSFDNKRDEGKRLKKAWEEDELVQTSKITLPEVPDLQKRILNLENLLKEPKWIDANDEFERKKKETERNPMWCSLFDGPNSIQELSSKVGRSAQYEMLYRPWSKAAHGDELDRQFQETESGGLGAAVFRNPDELKDIITFAFDFFTFATNALLTYYRPEEISNGSYSRWYAREIRNDFLKLYDTTKT